MKATVKRAVDEDTLELDNKVRGADRVRLIGVDTPELHGKDGKPEPYAEAARKFTADSLAGKDVLLAIGKDPTDDYQRLLAYVWTTPGDGLMGKVNGMLGDGPRLFNRTLVDKGYARVMTVPPNDRYAGCFEAAQKAAQSSGDGRWTTAATTYEATMGGSTADGTTLSTPPQRGESTGSATSPTTTATTTPTTLSTTAPERTSATSDTSPTTADTITPAPLPSTTPTTTGTTDAKPAAGPEPATSPRAVGPTNPNTAAVTNEPPVVRASTQPDSTANPGSVTTNHLPDVWPPVTSAPQVSPATTPSTVPTENLPTTTTDTGETKHVLPDTGGACSPFWLLLGAALVGAGLLILCSATRGENTQTPDDPH